MSRILICSLLAMAMAFVSAGPVFAQAAPAWQPKTTRVFMVCLAKFKGEKEPSFTTEDRLDDDLIDVFKDRGVPDDQIVFLQDRKATTANLRQRFPEFLRQSRKGELLIFYIGSHGSYDADKGLYEFSTFDGDLPFTWIFDTIERNFKGSQALLFADCCHSGGLAELARQRRGNMPYAVLSSTYCHNVAWSQWRFVQCLIRGFEGDPLIDLDDNGSVDLAKLARYTERYMAFAAEGRPTFVTTNGFNPRLKLADAEDKKKDPQLGKFVEVKVDGKWHKGEIEGMKGKRYRVRFVDSDGPDDGVFDADRVRFFQAPRFPVGSRVQVKGASSGKWYPATVLGSWESLHHCRFDNYSPAYDEWVGPSRIRALR